MPTRDTYRPDAVDAAMEALDEALQVVRSAAGPVLNGVPVNEPWASVARELYGLKVEWGEVPVPPDEAPLTLHNIGRTLDRIDDQLAHLAQPFDAVAVGRLLDQAGVASVTLHRLPVTTTMTPAARR
jgi:hypothetical protein